VKCQNPAQLLL